MRPAAQALVMSFLLLAGCGGGGGDSSEPADPTPSASPTLSVTNTPTATPSPFPEILLATGRSFRGTREVPLVLRNDGSGWVAVPVGAAPPLTILNGIVFSTSETAWAYGFRGDQSVPVLLRTVDAGLTWTDVTASLPSAAAGLFDVAFADPQTGYVASRGVFTGFPALVTRDGGTSWDTIAVDVLGLAGAYAVGVRGTAAELVRYESGGLSVVRLDDPAAAPLILSPGGGSRILGGNAFSTVDLRGWLAVSMPFPPGSAGSRAVILASAVPGAEWVEQPIAQSGFGELYAIDVRDDHAGIAGGNGLSPVSGGLSPLALVMSADGAWWDVATVTGVPDDAIVVDLVRLRGDDAWAITNAFIDGRSESAFLRSDDGGRSWHHEATPFEHDIRLLDLARNTELH
jgi:photosystem II stability/assembly factor-like uncharacterized protein